MNRESPIEHAFELLNRWRHLPAYRLEPRADIFFALYLPEVLGEHFGVKINPLLVPEFPIKKALLERNKDSKHSDSIKADYLALQESEDGKPAERAFLVELKTDMASRRTHQDEDLRDAIDNVKLKELIKGVIDLCGGNTQQKQKYVHLLKLLDDLKLIEYDDSLFPVERGYSRTLETIKKKVDEREAWPSLELVYVQPTTNTIDFSKFADIIEKGGGADGIRRTFASHLRKWASEIAGSPDPRKWRSR